MKIPRYWIRVLVYLSLILTPPILRAGEPTAQLSATINDFVTILAATPVAELRANGLPEKARKLIFARFDFSELTKRALGPHWKKLEPKEQGEFVHALTQRLLATYGRTVRSSSAEKIQFKREFRDADQAQVETTLLGDRGGELTIDYRLHDVNGEWKVYDVLIDHISLVANYRAQFDRVIARSSVHELLRMVKDQDS